MNHYADSSFLVSCYIIDANTAKAKAWLSRAGAPLAFTLLHDLEVRTAFRLGVYRNLLSEKDAAEARANLELDLRRGHLVKTAVNWTTAFRIASRLSEKHSALTGTRSLDVLHLAAARTLRTVELLSFDTRQRSLAEAMGMSTAPRIV